MFTLIGIVFGAVFVFVNAGELPGQWAAAVRIIGIFAVLAALRFGLVRGDPSDASVPDRRSLRVYWAAVIAEVIAIPLGALVITKVFERPEHVVLWVVLVVGVHFLPARVFGFPAVTHLGLAMIAIAVIGTTGALAIESIAAPIAAVITGFVMLAFSASAS
jgi:hypothetical protein